METTPGKLQSAFVVLRHLPTDPNGHEAIGCFDSESEARAYGSLHSHDLGYSLFEAKVFCDDQGTFWCSSRAGHRDFQEIITQDKVEEDALLKISGMAKLSQNEQRALGLGR